MTNESGLDAGIRFWERKGEGGGAVRSYDRAPEGEGLPEVSDPESDGAFRLRLLRVVSEKDRHLAMVAAGAQLDLLGRKYDRFRTGVPLKGFEAVRDRS